MIRNEQVNDVRAHAIFDGPTGPAPALSPESIVHILRKYGANADTEVVAAIDVSGGCAWVPALVEGLADAVTALTIKSLTVAQFDLKIRYSITVSVEKPATLTMLRNMTPPHGAGTMIHPVFSFAENVRAIAPALRIGEPARDSSPKMKVFIFTDGHFYDDPRETLPPADHMDIHFVHLAGHYQTGDDYAWASGQRHVFRISV